MYLDCDILKREDNDCIIFGVGDRVVWTRLPLSDHYIIIIDKDNLLSKCGGSEDRKHVVLEKVITSGIISNEDFEYYDPTKITYLNDASKRTIMIASSSDYITIAEIDSLPQWFKNEIVLWKLQE